MPRRSVSTVTRARKSTTRGRTRSKGTGKQSASPSRRRRSSRARSDARSRSKPVRSGRRSSRGSRPTVKRSKPRKPRTAAAPRRGKPRGRTRISPRSRDSRGRFRRKSTTRRGTRRVRKRKGKPKPRPEQTWLVLFTAGPYRVGKAHPSRMIQVEIVTKARTAAEAEGKAQSIVEHLPEKKRGSLGSFVRSAKVGSSREIVTGRKEAVVFRKQHKTGEKIVEQRLL